MSVGEDSEDPDKALYLRPNRAARRLEVVVAARADGSELVIHAMTMQSKYAPLIASAGDGDA